MTQKNVQMFSILKVIAFIKIKFNKIIIESGLLKKWAKNHFRNVDHKKHVVNLIFEEKVCASNLANHCFGKISIFELFIFDKKLLVIGKQT